MQPPAAPAQRRLELLADGRSFRVADGEADPRGWTVVAGDAVEIGSVADLVIDVDALDVRYLECRVAGAGDVVLLPIGFVRFDAAARLVIVDVLGSAELRALATPMRIPTCADDEAAVTAPFLRNPVEPEPDG